MNRTVADEIATAQLCARAKLFSQLANQCSLSVQDAGAAIARCFGRGGKLLIAGNGGSAAHAQHIAAEFVGRSTRERRPLPAIALTTDTSTITAIANDYGFEKVFSRQVEALAKAEDVLMLISTSGSSPNVLAAARVAVQLGLTTIGLTSSEGVQLSELVDVPILVPCQDTQMTQEVHIAIGHILSEIVEAIMFDSCSNNLVPGANEKHTLGSGAPCASAGGELRKSVLG